MPKNSSLQFESQDVQLYIVVMTNQFDAMHKEQTKFKGPGISKGKCFCKTEFTFMAA